MPNIIVRNYEHYNRAMGKHITSKRHYEQEMLKGGYIPFEQAEQMAELTRERNTKKYDGLSPEKMKFLNEVKGMADKKGNIKVGTRFIKGLQEHKVISKDLGYYSQLPKSYDKGRFE